MEHSKYYQKVKTYWSTGLWNIVRVKNAVIKKWITEDEFSEITGVIYIP